LASRFESDSFEVAEQEFFEPFPTDSYVNLDEETIQFFRQQLDSNNRAVQEAIKDNLLDVDVLIESFQHDLFHLIANIVIDLDEQQSKNKETNVVDFNIAKSF
jgi:hypothetical protein